ncbi:hypothetical protein Tco_0974467 [Tanacetum coccineum]|uniref:Uncharacterized protein n=1 Tax=Tanacetum coccineum TaxID=301880 RepID=A0ABQ5EBM9_9ASTR
MLVNYEVANGYQLWFMQNDHSKLLVYYGRDVSEGKCAFFKGKKPKGKTKDVRCSTNSNKGDTPDDAECSSKPATKKNGRISEIMKKKWNDKKEYEKKRLQKSVPCPFRLWACWMSTEMSFQIKSSYPDHKCCRNYTLGSLVTYRLIAHHYAREIIDNPSLTYRYIQNSIKGKFLLYVSLGQCKRAKICALYNHDGGLIEHYSKLLEYRKAVLESNPGSTCHLETEDMDDDGKITFKRMYICFKGIKQGWLNACRKVIGLDDCFLMHTCKGQLLTAIEDLYIGYGGGITVISNGHKGLLEVVAVPYEMASNAESINLPFILVVA